MLLAATVAGAAVASSWWEPGATTGAARPELPRMFTTGDQCLACHNGLVTPDGEDVSIGNSWRGSIMANSSRDPYWQAAVRREVMDHPEARETIENECSKCHMPMSNYRERAAGRKGRIFTHLPIGGRDSRLDRLAADGVSCTLCHQILAEKLGSPESFTGEFLVDSRTPWGRREMFGPFEVPGGRASVMSSAVRYQPARADHIQRSELCATCHTLYTKTLGPEGEVIGELPEQVPYLEWRHSRYRGARSCQSCHMPAVKEETAIASVLGEPRESLSRHAFRGGNFFMLRLFNRYRHELGVTALSRDLNASLRSTERNLTRDTATVDIASTSFTEAGLEIDVRVRNLTGHKLPTAYPSRRAWLHVVVRDRSGEVVFESGALEPDGSIAGNDNDADPTSYEPHRDRVEAPDQVQIYEPIMVTPGGEVTTGLLSAIRFIKDNRLLPEGFNKETAGEDIAVQGRAAEDATFAGGGDRVTYVAPVAGAEGPLEVRAELWYQPIGYRWAHNLEPYRAAEPRRFLRYYEEMSEVSGLTLASASATVAGAPP